MTKNIQQSLPLNVYTFSLCNYSVHVFLIGSKERIVKRETHISAFSG